MELYPPTPPDLITRRATSKEGRQSVLYKADFPTLKAAHKTAERIFNAVEYLMPYLLFIIYQARARFHFTFTRIAIYLNKTLRCQAADLALTPGLVKELFRICNTEEGPWRLVHEQWATLWVHGLSEGFIEKLRLGLEREEWINPGAEDLKLGMELPLFDLTYDEGGGEEEEGEEGRGEDYDEVGVYESEEQRGCCRGWMARALNESTHYYHTFTPPPPPPYER